MDEELERICMNCHSYYPDRLDEPTEFGICLNDSDFEPYLDELLEKQNFNCCKELIARKRFNGNREVCEDFEMVEIEEDPILEQELEELAKDDNISKELHISAVEFFTYEVLIVNRFTSIENDLEGEGIDNTLKIVYN